MIDLFIYFGQREREGGGWEEYRLGNEDWLFRLKLIAQNLRLNVRIYLRIYIIIFKVKWHPKIESNLRISAIVSNYAVISYIKENGAN